MKIISRTPTAFFSNTEVWHIKSDSVDQVYRICVTAPPTPVAPGDKLGALYGLDAGLGAGAYVSAARTMGLGGDLPPLFVVSIGYPVEGGQDHLLLRNRDLTPSLRADFDASFPFAKMMPDLQIASGGAAAFLSFLRDELKPLLEAEYPIAADDATLIGASFGGLFTCYAMLASPLTFQRYAPISPSVWWDGQYLMPMAKAFAKSKAVTPLSVAFGCGELESASHMARAVAKLPPEVRESMGDFLKASRDIDMIKDMRAFAKIVAKKPGVKVLGVNVYPGETHNSVLGVALSHQLRALFGTL